MEQIGFIKSGLRKEMRVDMDLRRTSKRVSILASISVISVMAMTGCSDSEKETNVNVTASIKESYYEEETTDGQVSESETEGITDLEAVLDPSEESESATESAADTLTTVTKESSGGTISSEEETTTTSTEYESVKETTTKAKETTTKAKETTTAKPTSTPAPTTTTAPATTTEAEIQYDLYAVTEANAVNYRSYYEEILVLVNQIRAEAGVAPLVLDDQLCKAATMRAVEMDYANLFSHTRPDGSSCFTVLSQYGISYRSCGENIAAGYSSPEDVVEGWKNSSGHYKNMVNSSYTKLGVGYAKRQFGEWAHYWVQLFTS